jgi:cytochrome P450
VTEVQDYVRDLLEARRAAPADDLISQLLAVQREGDRLSAAECVQLVVNLLAGGIDTTAAQLAHAVRLFAEHPRQWELLAENPRLVPRAVEEVLRFEPVTPFTARICLEQVEHRDVVFPAGTIVAVCAERANRDGDDGERFDITAARDARLLTFGAGAHYCLGANLARAELAEALAFLAPRARGLALDGPPQLGGVEGIYGIDKLPIAWKQDHLSERAVARGAGWCEWPWRAGPRYLIEPAVRPPTTRPSISANRMNTGMVATTDAPNRCCQSTVYWPMNESSRTVSG